MYFLHLKAAQFNDVNTLEDKSCKDYSNSDWTINNAVVPEEGKKINNVYKLLNESQNYCFHLNCRDFFFHNFLI